MSETDIKKQELKDKYGIEKIERMSIGAGHRDGYWIYFKEEVPKTMKELEHICIFMTEYFFGYEISVDRENKRVAYWGYTR